MAKTTHINKSKIMKDAWALYCRIYHSVSTGFTIHQFGHCLSQSWADAKRKAKHAAAIAKLSKERVDNQFAGIRRQIDHTKYLPFAINQAKRVKSLQAELSALRRAA